MVKMCVAKSLTIDSELKKQTLITVRQKWLTVTYTHTHTLWQYSQCCPWEYIIAAKTARSCNPWLYRTAEQRVRWSNNLAVGEASGATVSNSVHSQFNVTIVSLDGDIFWFYVVIGLVILLYMGACVCLCIYPRNLGYYIMGGRTRALAGRAPTANNKKDLLTSKDCLRMSRSLSVQSSKCRCLQVFVDAIRWLMWYPSYPSCSDL